ncbi:MAG TPA: cupin domain-containing protein, partial [Rubrobacteraceae bacterium]|nr:cupin domain-containing protein [Rubrobacteraceae bacterium]
GELNTFKVRHAGFAILESTTPPGGGMPPHVHHSQEETVYVLEGEYVFFSGEEELVVGPGSLVSISRGTTHAFKVTGQEPGRCLMILTPPGPLERFFEEVGVPVGNGASSGSPEMEEVLASARRNGIELLITPV